MKSLLAAIKLELQNAATLSFVRDSDIFITEHENFLLPSIRFPAIAIKDGPIVYKVATKSQENDTLLVKIIMYVQLQKPGPASWATRRLREGRAGGGGPRSRSVEKQSPFRPGGFRLAGK